MRLLSLRVSGLPPFGDVTLPVAEEDGSPRALTVLFGGSGVGKTTLLGALANTRPGYAVALAPGGEGPQPFAVTDWALGMDDPDRPHPLRIATPTARLSSDEPAELMRRREQAHFERVARDSGHALLVIPSTRWFSRQPVAISAPARSVARYDVRATTSLDDATRSDLTRETKQAIAYAAISAALSRDRAGSPYARLGEAMTLCVDALASLADLSYAGVDAASFEPTFRTPEGRLLPLDALPNQVRHLVAFGALTVRTLWGAYPQRDPLDAEGVVCIDEIELQQPPAVQSGILAVLRRILPRVQWVVTTTSPLVAASAESREVIALRRLPRAQEVELFSGPEARVH